MDVQPCGHLAALGVSRLCPHLLGDDGVEGAVALLTGEGIRCDWCCRACDEAGQAGRPAELVSACEGCVARVADDPDNPVAWRGTPGIRRRPEAVDTTLVFTDLPHALHDPEDVAPLGTRSDGRWAFLTSGLRLVLVDPDDLDDLADLADLDDLDDLDERPPAPVDDSPHPSGHRPHSRVHCSDDGRFVAVVTDYGWDGLVAELSDNLGTLETRVTLELDRGDYHVEQTSFPFAFLPPHPSGRGVTAIHATDWNRLDASDPATGRLLTPRETTPAQAGEPRPEHYLDYFHGRLTASPGGRWVVDDGWVWAPIGIPMVFDAHRWLGGNVFETEDGPSLRTLSYRDYHWDVPLCWIDDDRLAVSGIGNDDEVMLAGVTVFDVATGHVEAQFAGPSGRLFSDGHRLYSAGPDGLDIWDPASGEQTGHVPGFRPTAYHRGTQELAAVEDGRLVRWRMPGHYARTA